MLANEQALRGIGPYNMTIYNNVTENTSIILDPSLIGYVNSFNNYALNVPMLAVGNSVAATTPGAIISKIQTFDQRGDSIGYLPVYNSIT